MILITAQYAVRLSRAELDGFDIGLNLAFKLKMYLFNN